MIISVNGREKKIAILDNGKVTEFYIERGEENSGIAGNIYKGRVQRVLPGMQSAFVSIGLERDAFLYVSDFFDEEEEIERIVMEKSKTTSAEEAKREANDQIERKRVEREKQMEAVQDIAEPQAEAAVVETRDEVATRSNDRKGRGRSRDDKSERQRPVQAPAEDLTAGLLIEESDSSFERIVDDEETPGEMFKDAYMQEAIVDRVRAVEFDLESTTAAEVGSIIGSVEDDASGFERIADEDDTPQKVEKKSRAKGPKKGGTKKATEIVAEEIVAETETSDSEAADPAKKPRTTRTKKPRGKAKKQAAAEMLEDAQASVTEPSDSAEMTVRRGGRGRRRGGRGRKQDETAIAEGIDEMDLDETTAADEFSEDAEISVTAPPESEEVSSPAEVAEKADAEEDAKPESRNRRDSRNGRDTRGGREGSRQENRFGRDQRNGDSRDQRDNRPKGGDGKRFERSDRRERPPQPAISDLLREGQEILVQIAKEPIARKGARITSHIALPGRYLVYMPTIEHLGVSRKIESSSERGRLRTLIQRIRQDEDIPSGGFIVRTAGIGISEEDLRNDARYLVRTWLDIKKTSEKAKSPAVVHQDLDIVQRILRDQMSDDFTAIRVDSEDEYLRTIEFMNRIQPRMVKRVKLYTREEPILDAYGVQEEIDKALKPRVWLKSGGYLVINQTEALVAIDVNTGKFVGKGNARLEDTITRTNLEAVDEIARQIRLRDLGGIIVLDLIDMEDRRNRNKVSQALQEALSTDKSPTKVLSFNDFGLIIMTRKRVKQSLERTMCTVCDYCDGSGWVKSPQTICFEILTETARLAKQMDDVKQTTLRIHPEVAKALRTTEREVFDEIEAHLGSVDLTADPHIHQAQFDFAFI